MGRDACPGRACRRAVTARAARALGGEDVLAAEGLADAEWKLLRLGNGDREGHRRGGQEPLPPIGIVVLVDVQVPGSPVVRGEPGRAAGRGYKCPKIVGRIWTA